MATVPYKIHAYGLSHQGNVRDHNEDSWLDLSHEGVWVVADGVGGHDRGDVASALITTQLQGLKASNLLGNYLKQVDAELQLVNEKLIAMRNRPGNEGILGSTVCVLILQDKHYICLWAGDSRIYLMRRGVLTLLTSDHNRMDEFRRAGFSEEELAKYPAARQLVHAVGVESPLFLEMKMQECYASDVFLLCSDGLHGELTEQAITNTLLHAVDPQAAVQSLVQQVLSGKARDNVTAVVVQLGSAI